MKTSTIFFTSAPRLSCFGDGTSCQSTARLPGDIICIHSVAEHLSVLLIYLCWKLGNIHLFMGNMSIVSIGRKPRPRRWFISPKPIAQWWRVITPLTSYVAIDPSPTHCARDGRWFYETFVRRLTCFVSKLIYSSITWSSGKYYSVTLYPSL